MSAAAKEQPSLLDRHDVFSKDNNINPCKELSQKLDYHNLMIAEKFQTKTNNMELLTPQTPSPHHHKNPHCSWSVFTSSQPQNR